MNTTPLQDRADRADDDLGRLLSRYFKAQMPDPWPAAPPTPAARAEPSGLAAPRNVDPGRRARYTLAVSVALVLGTCWAFSNGFRPGDRPGGPAPPHGGDGFDLKGTSADGKGGLTGEIKKVVDGPGARQPVDDPLDLDKGN
ncbi:MAG: hypothetical protein C0501_29525 [Isosphaera sp.]|nr:hypothetical protein [Isosphaera sp.]